MGPDQQIELSSHSDLDLAADEWGSLVTEWRSLVDRTGGSYFQLPDWTLGWWRTIGRRPPTTIAVWRGDDGLEAVAAVSRVRTRLSRRLPVTVATIINTGSGAGAADHLGFPSSPARRPDVATWVDDLRGGSVVLSNLGQATADALPARHRVVDHTPCPRLAIGPDHPMGRSAGYRRQVRAKVRKAEAAGVAFELVAPERFDPALLDELMDLHQRRWSDRSGTSSFTRDRLPLHRELVRTAGPGRGPTAIVASHEARTVGIVYGFLQGDTFSFFQSGWDPDYSRLGLGTVVHAVGFELLAAAGVTTYDFLRGDEEYKYRFGAQDLVDVSTLDPRGVGGWALIAKNRLRETARRRAAGSPTPASPN